MRKSAFTLAEVLITLVIIGVIAAMTIPTLMGSTNDQEIRTAFKKAISAANQAVALDYALYGTNLRDEDTSILVRVLKNHMSVIEDNVDGQWNYFKTADGMIYRVDFGCKFRVDVNGAKGNGQDEVDEFKIHFDDCGRTAVPGSNGGTAMLFE